MKKTKILESGQSKRFQYTSFHVEQWVKHRGRTIELPKELHQELLRESRRHRAPKSSGIGNGLYLTDGKKREKHWKSLGTHLAKLDVKQATIDHLIEQDDPQLAAQLVQKLSNAAG